MPSHRVRSWLSSSTARLVRIAGACVALLGAGSVVGAPPAPLVRFDGCTAVRRSGSELSCLVKPQSEVTLWAESVSCNDLYVTESGAAIDVATSPVNGGCQIRFPVGTTLNVTPLEVLSTQTATPWLSLTIDRSNPTFLERKERMERRALPNVDVGVLLTRIAQATNQEDKIDFTWTLAIAHERNGKIEQALNAYSQIIELANNNQYPYIAVSAAAKRGELLFRAGEYTEARRALSQVKDNLDERLVASYLQWTEWNIVLPDISSEEALPVLDKLIRIAAALRNFSMQRDLTTWFIQALTDTNRLDEASKALSSFSLEDLPDCRKSMLLANQAWLATDLIERRPEFPTELVLGTRTIRSIQAEAFTLRNDQCSSAGSLVTLANGMARVALLEDRLADAKVAIDQAKSVRSLVSNSYVALSLIDYEAQWSVRTDRKTQALSLFSELARRANSAGDPEGFSCRAAVGLLEVAHVLNRDDEASRAMLKTCLPVVKKYNPPQYMNLTRRLGRITGG